MGQNFFKRDDRDVRFVLKEHLGIQRLLGFDAYKDFSMDDFDMILKEAMKIASEEIAPTFQDGDRDGCRFEGGKVYVPKSYHRCWEVFKEGGWFGLAMNPEYSGQGVPSVISEATQEFFMSANFAFCCFSGMGPGNGYMIERFGSKEQKDLFLEKMYDGTWGGTMCLTEPSVGSDAHMVTVKATPDGKYYKIQGTKTFITSGEHDLTENIIHLLIGRIEGAPQGAKGVSLFIVPKIRVNDDGSLGEANDVTCIALEHKMGMNGSATCMMNFGENGNCRARLIGEPGMGLAYMFQMVNMARMAVGLESVGFGANIYANALDYAKNRIQGAPFGKKGLDRVRLIEHVDIRRMLMNLKALTEGMRALVYKTYMLEDIAEASPDEEERKWASNRVDLSTPIIKAYCSDRIFEMGREGIQILGGYGLTKEYPIEQYTRDCKILSIWDGTNYIQSVDLAGRKLRMEGGKVFMDWIDEVLRFVQNNSSISTLADEMKLVEEAVQAIVEISISYGRYFKEGKINLVPLTSTKFLDCCAEVAISHLLLEQALISLKRLDELGPDHFDSPFYRGKIETARFYVRNFLPNVFGRGRIIKLEDMTAIDMAEESL
ncbi:MAG: acyl-CoA dehydrogenase [Thermodesulfobacteriota bacterium]|nr:acyl-CoA dehydrogenase [Thermodesulfobacteriota bacterium]